MKHVLMSEAFEDLEGRDEFEEERFGDHEEIVAVAVLKNGVLE